MRDKIVKLNKADNDKMFKLMKKIINTETKERNIKYERLATAVKNPRYTGNYRTQSHWSQLVR